MPAEDKENEYEIVIGYDNFITRYDLNEIISSIDEIIESELMPFKGVALGPPFRNVPEFSYIGIRGITSGSIILSVIVSGAVANYVGRRFKKGINKSILAEEIERSGHITGDFFGDLLGKVNNWAEIYVRKQREQGGNITRIEVKKETRKKKDRG